MLSAGPGRVKPVYAGQALVGQGVTALSVEYFGRHCLPGQLRGITDRQPTTT
jgi:hypothetical protein